MAEYNDDYVHDRIKQLESIINNELKPRIHTLEQNLAYVNQKLDKLIRCQESLKASDTLPVQFLDVVKSDTTTHTNVKATISLCPNCNLSYLACSCCAQVQCTACHRLESLCICSK